MSNAKISCCEVGEHCQKNDKKLLIWFWKLADNSGSYFVLFLLFCKEKNNTKRTKQIKRKITNPKKIKQKPHFCSLLVEQYEWCTYAHTQPRSTINWLTVATYLFTKYILAVTSLMWNTMSHIRETMHFKSNHSVKKSIQLLQYSYFPQFHHTVSSQKKSSFYNIQQVH